MTFTILFVGSRDVGRGPLAAALTARELRRIWPRSADEVAVVSAGVARYRRAASWTSSTVTVVSARWWSESHSGGRPAPISADSVEASPAWVAVDSAIVPST